MAVAATAGITAFGALSTSALSAVGDFEQLQGGVETLFSTFDENGKMIATSSATVMKQASEAYKTAGLSANDYMNTVNSFAATLKQSVGGDLDLMAEKSNQAVIDMSDNANKMGTSMESIQNAYQGFAKQNYTMLDNLKLGYGGTKEEMQRLLQDAEKLKAKQGEVVEYSIDSFADVVDAIHVVQEELQITGTTAREAATTIQGSIASLSGAWKNFLSGAGGTEEVVDAFENTVDIIAKNMGDIIPRLATGVVEIGGELMQYFATGISQNKDVIIQTAVDMVDTFVEALINLLPSEVRGVFNDAFKDIKKSFESGGLRTVIETASNVFKAFSDVLVAIAKTVVPPFIKILDFVGKNIKTLTPLVVASVAAFKGYSIIKTVTANITRSTTAVKLLTGQVGLATVAQKAWNVAMNANPIGLTIAAVGALGAGFLAYKAVVGDVVTLEERQADRLRDLSDATQERLQTMQELEQQSQKQIEADLYQIDLSRQQWNELRSIVDANGQIKEGYEERAKVLTTQISDALGVEMEIVDGQIQKYGELESQIGRVIAQKKAEAVLSARNAEYTEALENINDARTAQAEISRAYNDALEKQAEALARVSELQAEYDAIKDSSTATFEEKDFANGALAAAKDELDVLDQAVASLTPQYEAATAAVNGYYQTISEYEGLSEAVASGDAVAIGQMLQQITTSYKTAGESNATELANQLSNQREALRIMREEYKSGNTAITMDMINQTKADMASMEKELMTEMESVKTNQEGMQSIIDSMGTGLSDAQAEQLGTWLAIVADAKVNGEDLSDETQTMVDEVMDNLDDLPEDTKETMKAAMAPLLEEMEYMEPYLYEQAEKMANGIIERLKEGLDWSDDEKVMAYINSGDKKDEKSSDTAGNDAAASTTNASISTVNANRSQYSPQQSVSTDVHVHLEGEAKGVFNLVRTENDKIIESTGDNPLNP